MRTVRFLTLPILAFPVLAFSILAFPVLAFSSLALSLPRAASAQGQQPPKPRQSPFLGVTTESIVKGDPKSGLRVIFLFPNSAAMAMGLKIGDEIIALNDIIIETQKSFSDELRREKVGATIRFLLRRKGEKLKIKGKIGNRQKTMNTLQNKLRAEQYGKPLRKLPPVKLWNVSTKTFSPTQNAIAHLEGKIGVIFSFDDCPHCTRERYQKIRQMAAAMKSTQPDLPLAFLGLYQSDSQDSVDSGKTTIDHATRMFMKLPPPFPVGAVYFPDGPPPPLERHKQLYIHQHGIAVLSPEGKLSYLQIHGTPEIEFGRAMQALMLELAKKTPPPDGK